MRVIDVIISIGGCYFGGGMLPAVVPYKVGEWPRAAVGGQVTHPPALAHSAQRKQLKLARASWPRRRAPGPKLNTQNRPIARAAKYGTNLGFRTRTPLAHHQRNCKNALCSRLKTRKKRFYFCCERPLNLGRMETESDTSDFGWGRVVCI